MKIKTKTEDKFVFKISKRGQKNFEIETIVIIIAHGSV